jgi:hypothetical protein
LFAIGFGYVISQSYRHFRVGRSDSFLNICIQLGGPRAAWLLTMFEISRIVASALASAVI